MAKRGKGCNFSRAARVVQLMKKPSAGGGAKPVGGNRAGRFAAKRDKGRDSARAVRIAKLMKKPAAGGRGGRVGGGPKVDAPCAPNVAADIMGNARSKSTSKIIHQLATMSDEDLGKFLYEIGFA